MALMRFVFNYYKALEWTTKYTGTPLYTPKNLPPKDAQACINRDIPRAFFFPKNKFSTDNSHFFYSGWTHINEPFCFMQGDMDGGSFVQLVWQIFAITTNNLQLIEGDYDLRFGYVGDDKKRHSIALMYSKEDPSKWMLCLTTDSEKASFDQRNVNIYMPSYFSEKLNISETSESIFQSNVFELLGKDLNSELLEQEFKTFFDEDNKIDIEKIKAFEKKEIKKMGAQYVEVDEDEISGELILPPPRNYFFDKLGSITFAAIGWYVGVFIVGPLLAMPTLGFSLIFAPPICVLIGAALGALIGSIISSCFSRCLNQPKKTSNNISFDLPSEEFSVNGSSHARIAKRGVQSSPAQTTTSATKEVVVKESEPSTPSLAILELPVVKSAPSLLSKL